MRAAHAVEQIRAAEAGPLRDLPEGTLMQRAAHGLAVAVAGLLGGAHGRRITLLVGSGDNGGDALLAGALLARRGASVCAVLLTETPHAAGLAALRASGGRVVDPGGEPGRGRPDVLLDGIAGIGGRGGLRPDAQAALAAYAGVPVVAVDVPTGIGVDTGELDGPHVTADLTVTFGTHRIGHLVDPAARACGTVHLVDLGLDLPPAPVEALQASDVAALLPRPDAVAQKYSRGVVGVAAGSRRYPGAGVLCVAGAATGLVGMVRYVGGAGAEVLAAHPDVVVGEGRVQAWVVGSGGDDEADEALRRARRDAVPVVADATALEHLDAPLPDGVLTPHAGELARLLGRTREEIEAHQLASAREAAARFEAVCLLKGRHTLIARPDGRVRVTTSGTPWLATAGAGDVLAGLIGALLAAGLSPFDAASVGSWLHGAAATRAGAGGPLRAQDVAAGLPAEVRSLLAGSPA